MKNLLFLFMAVLPLLCFGQNSNIEKTRKFALGFTISPDYCYRTLKTDNNPLRQKIVSRRDSLEEPRIGFTTGLNFRYYIRKNISVEAGILFSDKGEKTGKYRTVYNTGDTVCRTKFVYHYQYIDIPVTIVYSVNLKKISLYLSAGLSSNLFLAQKTKAFIEINGDVEAKTISETGLYSKLNFAAIGGIGIEYHISSRISISLEPVYRRSINSIIDMEIKGYLYSIGLNAGIYYKI